MKLRPVFFLVFTFATAAGLAAGYRFRATTHSEGTASAAISMADIQVAGRVDGPKARIEIEKSRNPLLPKGNALLTLDGGKTFALIDPIRKTSTTWSPPERGSGKAPGASVVQVRLQTPEVQKLAESEGARISGYATKYFKYRVRYVAEVDVMGSVQKTETSRIEELWTAPALTDAGFAAWLRKDAAPTGNGEFDKRIAAALSGATGVPLKRVTTTSWKDASGKEQTVRTTLVVSELMKSPAVAGLFEVPRPLPRP